MDRPSKKAIKDAIAKLKSQSPDSTGGAPNLGSQGGKLAPKKSSQRIRKQGV